MSGADFGGLRAGWGRGSLWPDLLMKGWRKVRLGQCVGLAGLSNEGVRRARLGCLGLTLVG